MKLLLSYSLILLFVFLTSVQAETSSPELTSSNRIITNEDARRLNRSELEGKVRIGDYDLYVRYQNAKPLLRNKDTGVLHFVEGEVDLQRLRNFSYMWSKVIPDDIKQFEEIVTIETYHTHASSSWFKPTISEVLAQIPSQLLGKEIFFEVNSNEVQNQNYMRFNFHTARTTFYRLIE